MTALAVLAQGKAAAGSMTPLAALLVAVTAAVLGSVFTLIGGFINDYFASRREERQQDRADRRQREQREHEYRMQQAKISKEEKLRVQQQRLETYQAFLDATNLHERTLTGARKAKHAALYKTYMATMLYAGDEVSIHASVLYRAADIAIEAEDDEKDTWAALDKARESFLRHASVEIQQ